MRMSKASIKAIDAYCRLCNLDNSMKSAFPEEMTLWAAKRGRALAKFRAALAKMTKDEFLRGRWGNTPIEQRLKQWDDMVRAAE